MSECAPHFQAFPVCPLFLLPFALQYGVCFNDGSNSKESSRKLWKQHREYSQHAQVIVSCFDNILKLSYVPITTFVTEWHRLWCIKLNSLRNSQHFALQTLPSVDWYNRKGEESHSSPKEAVLLAFQLSHMSRKTYCFRLTWDKCHMASLFLNSRLEQEIYVLS